MIKLFTAFIAISFFLTIINTTLYSYLEGNNYALLTIFLINTVCLALVSVFFVKGKDSNNVDSDESTVSVVEKSVEVFIRVLIFFLPIVVLIGLYMISSLGVLQLDSANNWVSFILSIAAFIMSLITLWQSQGTYNRIFDALDEIKTKTISIEKDTASVKEEQSRIKIAASNKEELGLKSAIVETAEEKEAEKKGNSVDEGEQLKNAMKSSGE
ncbi:hypothetical protein RYX45_01560 [Alkalihalophilus pseudofirmus]|uniref:Uncharacterized protein n=1 Tax=Alkalihalophilus pseudofirmus TaxID=79885 RepID=A0AAJ2NMJ9_ALKPS|nr:hypothetical protein [Alkalihalophilus pseudofirmus]MDV2883850.1 hypothetical protein [Alkalihalophilus pseudofirmus]